MKRRKWAAIVFLVILLLGAAGASGRAQSPTTLAVIPASVDFTVDNTSPVSLYVTGGVNVNAFDVRVSYDPAVLELVSWSYGDYLSNLAQVYKQDTPGFFWLAATQLATPGKSGDGTLLNLVFRGAGNGISPVEIVSASFSSSDLPPQSTYPVRLDGAIHVHSDPSPIPARTLTGSFTLQGRSESGGIPISLGYGFQHWLGPFSAVTLDAPAPNLSIPGVYDDSYTLATGQPRYLNVTPELDKTKTVGAGSTTIAPLRLLGGNAVWQREAAGELVPDTVIDQADLDLVLDQYHRSGPGLDGDVNFSGKVDILDLALAAGNFELTSEMAYGGWVP